MESQHDATRHNTTRHYTTRHSTAQHSAAQHNCTFSFASARGPGPEEKGKGISGAVAKAVTGDRKKAVRDQAGAVTKRLESEWGRAEAVGAERTDGVPPLKHRPVRTHAARNSTDKHDPCAGSWRMKRRGKKHFLFFYIVEVKVLLWTDFPIPLHNSGWPNSGNKCNSSLALGLLRTALLALWRVCLPPATNALRGTAASVRPSPS